MATIGHTFTFTVYCKRHDDLKTYRLVLTEKGWNVAYFSQTMNGDCDPDGSPKLYENIEHDGINYPNGLYLGMDYLHRQKRILDDAAMQAALTQLAEWVSTTEKASPTTGAFDRVFDKSHTLD